MCQPENLLLVSPINTVSPQIKLIDFGSSIRVNRQGGSASTMLGTLGYVAPEVLKGKAYTGAVGTFLNWDSHTVLVCVAYMLLTDACCEMQTSGVWVSSPLCCCAAASPLTKTMSRLSSAKPTS